MFLLHFLLAVAFGLLWYNHVKLNALHKALETQGEINKVTMKAFNLLKEDIENDRVLHDKTIKSVKSAIKKIEKTK